MSKKKKSKGKYLVILPFLLMMIPMIFIIFIVATNDDSGRLHCDSNSDLSEEVLVLKPKIESEIKEQGIGSNHLNWILALVSQESGGKGNDPFQASESHCGRVGCITDIDTSVKAGVKTYANRIKYIEDKNLNSTPELILQSYNFGVGYIDYLVETKQTKYTKANALNFSIKMCGTAGTSEATAVNVNKKGCYGDYLYIEHISKYLSLCTFIAGDGIYAFPYQQKQTVYVTQRYMNYNSSLYNDRPHIGYDFDGGDHSLLYAVCNGIVELIDPSQSHGYGVMVMLKCQPGVYVIYGHMSVNSITVTKGQQVVAGITVLGKQGNTGYSTGSHLHLEFRTTADFRGGHLDPNKYIDIYKYAK